MNGKTPASADTDRQPVAVFDLDGTCISGQSGSLIALWLYKRGYLSKRAALGLLWWGIRYELHLPNRQERSRELIFGNLSSYSPDQIDRIMVEFHQEVMVPRYRRLAVEQIGRLKEAGCDIVIISATFEVIAREATNFLGADGYVATKMEKDAQGRYTGFVLGDVIEGTAKVKAVRSWADQRFGADGWDLEYAYGDHYSDVELLQQAKHPVAVSPGPNLRRTAAKCWWPVVNWKVC